MQSPGKKSHEELLLCTCIGLCSSLPKFIQWWNSMEIWMQISPSKATLWSRLPQVKLWCLSNVLECNFHQHQPAWLVLDYESCSPKHLEGTSLGKANFICYIGSPWLNPIEVYFKKGWCTELTFSIFIIILEFAITKWNELTTDWRGTKESASLYSIWLTDGIRPIRSSVGHQLRWFRKGIQQIHWG